jgi:hypothetical protein
MKNRTAQIAMTVAAICLAAISLAAQTPTLPNMDHEPHHHLAIQNALVKIFDVRVAPGDSIILHSHDKDTVAIAIGDQLVTVGIPGKPDVHQKNADAQVRLQRSGYVHSTHVDGDTPYHTVAVELMQPQTNFHNVCAEVLPGQPVPCPLPPFITRQYENRPLLASDQTQVWLARVYPHQSVDMSHFSADQGAPQVIVALDAALLSSEPARGPDKALQPGDFVSIDAGADRGRIYQNRSDKEARFIEILFPHAE